MELHERLGVSKSAYDFVERIELDIADIIKKFDEIASYNNYKVLDAFRRVGVAARHLTGTTGYGYSDSGRDKLGELFAEIFGAEDAIVSPLIASGTHALTTALFGILRPLDTMLSVTGRPYDTLTGVIGIDGQDGTGSLADFAVKYKEVALKNDYSIDVDRVIDELIIDNSIKMVYIQRSRGYEWRPSLTIDEIGRCCKAVRARNKDVFIVVDNCYGEFTETREPTEVGADLIIGSLIKNPGAGIAPTGAYFAGSKRAVELVSYRLTCPGIGGEIGSYLAGYMPYFQGIFFAPGVVRNALAGAAMTASAMKKFEYRVFPEFDAVRPDITQAICFNTEEELLAFVRAVQKASPVDSNVVPYPWEMPGYQHDVIMAAGTFIQGASIELSADAPIKCPYITYMQGGLTLENTKLALMTAIDDMGLLKY